MTKNILKSFFLVTLASLLLFSCTNVNDPTAVLEGNGVLTTNKLIGVDITKLPDALNGQEVTISINGQVVDKGTVTNGTLRKSLSDKAVFDGFADKNELTLVGMGSDNVTYKFGKYVNDAFALGYAFDFVEGGYNSEAPEFVFKGDCSYKSEAVTYQDGAKIHWWNIAGVANTDWVARPDMTVEAVTGGNKYSYTFDTAVTTLVGAGVIIAFKDDYDNCKLTGGNIEGDSLADVTSHGVYNWNDSAKKFEKDEEASVGATAITLVYVCLPVSEVILPATFNQPQTLVIKNSFDNSELTITGIVAFGGEVDGSNWSWNGGKALTGDNKLVSSTGVFVANAATATPDWVIAECPWTIAGNFPEGFDAAYKIKLDKTEAWVPYKVGGKVEYNWCDRQ